MGSFGSYGCPWKKIGVDGSKEHTSDLLSGLSQFAYQNNTWGLISKDIWSMEMKWGQIIVQMTAICGCVPYWKGNVPVALKPIKRQQTHGITASWKGNDPGTAWIEELGNNGEMQTTVNIGLRESRHVQYQCQQHPHGTVQIPTAPPCLNRQGMVQKLYRNIIPPIPLSMWRIINRIMKIHVLQIPILKIPSR